MSSPKVLNLDDLTSVTKTVTLDKTVHEAVELTVDAYIARVKRAKELAAERESGEVSPLQQVEDAVEFLVGMFPTIDADRMRRMTMKQLSTLIAFAMSAPDDVAEKAAEKAEQAGNA